jgi:hypothetical protein
VAKLVQPALPGQPFQVAGAVGVAGFNQRHFGQVFHLGQAVFFQQPGAGHGRELLAKQTNGPGRRGLRHHVAQGQVHIGGGQVHRGV